MSIFPCQNPFQPRKAPARKLTTISPLKMDASQRAQEFGLDYGPAILRLEDDLTVEFDPNEGDWFNGMNFYLFYLQSVFKLILDSEPTNVNSKKRDKTSEILNNAQQKLLSVGIQLQEENEVLKSKNEILINMIAEVYSEFKLERDIKK